MQTRLVTAIGVCRRALLQGCLFVVLPATALGHPQNEWARPAGPKPTIAVVPSRNDRPAPLAGELAEKLLALVTDSLSHESDIALVERRELAAALRELSTGQLVPMESSAVHVGRLVSADFVATLEVRTVDTAEETAIALWRLAHVSTAAVIGVTATRFHSDGLEQAAIDLASFTVQSLRQPEAEVRTIAVAPFVSLGRFDRIRPLETGVRDLVTARLLQLTQSVGAETSRSTSSAASRLQVLQRSSLADLIAELELIRSGLTDTADLNHPAPPPAAWLVSGTLDERPGSRGFAVLVTGELIDARTGAPVAKFQVECPPERLDREVSNAVDRLVESLLTGTAPQVSPPDSRLELQHMKQQGLADLRRFRRISPIDFSPRPFRLPADPQTGNTPKLVAVDSPLGRHLLQNAVDRFESVLLLAPDDADAAFGLAFCCAMHEPELYRPARADELYRRIAASSDDPRVQALAYERLAEMSYHHATCQLDPREREAAHDRIWTALRHTPESARSYRWARLTTLAARAGRESGDERLLRETVERCLQLVQEGPQEQRRQLARGAVDAIRLYSGLDKRRQDDLAAWRDELIRWTRSADAVLRTVGTQALAQEEESEGQFLAAAHRHEAAADAIALGGEASRQHDQGLELVNAARNYTLANDPQRALQVLGSFEPPAGTQSLLAGMRCLEQGKALESLENPQEALQAYLNGVSASPLIVSNSDIGQRIQRLGGVPLSRDRTIEVEYPNVSSLRHRRIRMIATDGVALYLALAPTGLWQYVPQTQECHPLSESLEVTALAAGDGVLWVGTKDGLWRFGLSGEAPRQFDTRDGLPDLRVTAVAVIGQQVFAGVGTSASGGVMGFDGERFEPLSGNDAPFAAPTHLIVTESRLLARTVAAVHELVRSTGSWKVTLARSDERPSVSPHLFRDDATIWASNYGRELTVWEGAPGEDRQYRPAWHTPDWSAGHPARFIVRQGDLVWIGGPARRPLLDSGLYCFDLKTAEFQSFGPRDGFRTLPDAGVVAGAWLGDRLWLSVRGELCTVRRR